mgnify:CR=1 FL=1
MISNLSVLGWRSIRDSRNRTPGHYAREEGHSDLVVLFQQWNSGGKNVASIRSLTNANEDLQEKLKAAKQTIAELKERERKRKKVTNVDITMTLESTTPRGKSLVRVNPLYGMSQATVHRPVVGELSTVDGKPVFESVAAKQKRERREARRAIREQVRQ